MYEQIAQDNGTTAQTVYEIAHGKPVNTSEERTIHDILLQLGIIRLLERK